MDTAEALDFLRANHRGVMATTKADGSTQMSPITVGVDGEGRVVVSSRETAYKVRHLRALPYAAICAFTNGFFGPWVQVEGPVEIVSLPEAMEPLVDYYRDISRRTPRLGRLPGRHGARQPGDPAHDRGAGRPERVGVTRPPSAHASAGATSAAINRRWSRSARSSTWR